MTQTKQSDCSDEDIEGGSLKGARATSHRRLPEIPDPEDGSDNPIVCLDSVRSSQDTSSELYAQVEIGKHTNPCKIIIINACKLSML